MMEHSLKVEALKNGTAIDHIPANTELCYDYGYFPGNVEGKHRACLCGALNCRKTLY